MELVNWVRFCVVFLKICLVFLVELGLLLWDSETFCFCWCGVCCVASDWVKLELVRSKRFRWSGNEVCRREMEVRSEGSLQVRCDKIPAPVIPRTRLQVWFIRVCSSILLWTCLVQLVAVGELWHPRLLTGISSHLSRITPYPLHVEKAILSPPPRPLPASEFPSFSICFETLKSS